MTRGEIMRGLSMAMTLQNVTGKRTPQPQDRFYLVDPAELDAGRMPSHGIRYEFSPDWYLDSSGPIGRCVLSDDFGHKTGMLTNPIPAKYKTLYITCGAVTQYAGPYHTADIALVDDYGITSTQAGYSGTVKKRPYLCRWSQTAEWINSQSGIIVHSTDPNALSWQTVEIDISSYNIPLYIGIHTCDVDFYFREIYAV